MNKIMIHISPISASFYPVMIGQRLLKRPNLCLSQLTKRHIKNIIIITDHIVKKYYGAKFIKTLKTYRYHQKSNIYLFSFPAGEKSKQIKIKKMLEEQMLKHRCDRDSLLIALGGGVVGDITGYIAATYMRGIEYIQIPTTLLAMVDSSVGGKTGIDNAYGKNLIGAFWQPKAVVADIDCLETLSKKHVVCGLVEALKMFLTSDLKSFEYFQKNFKKILVPPPPQDKIVLKNIIKRAIKIKGYIVQEDEKENNKRMILNFGHTIGHAIEKISNYKILHGIAVGLGILVESKIAEILGILAPEKYLIIYNILLDIGINIKDLDKFNVQKIIQATYSDKKSKNAQARYVLIKDIGKIYANKKNIVHAVPEKIIKQAFLEVLDLSEEKNGAGNK